MLNSNGLLLLAAGALLFEMGCVSKPPEAHGTSRTSSEPELRKSQPLPKPTISLQALRRIRDEERGIPVLPPVGSPVCEVFTDEVLELQTAGEGTAFAVIWAEKQANLIDVGLSLREPPWAQGPRETAISWTIGKNVVETIESSTNPSGHREQIGLLARQNQIVRVVRSDDGPWLNLILQKVSTGDCQVITTDVDSPPPTVLVTGEYTPTIALATLDLMRVWTLNSSQMPHVFLDDHFPGPIAIHPQGTWYATPCPAFIAIRSTVTGKKECEFTDCDSIDIRTIAFSRSGKYLAIAGEYEADGERVIAWDWQARKKLIDSPGCGNRTHWAAFTNSERFLLTVNSSSSLSIWDLTGEASARHLSTAVNITGGIAITDDDELMIVGCRDGLKAYRLKELLDP